MGKPVKIPIHGGNPEPVQTDGAEACDPSASKPSPPRKHRPVAFRQSDVVRALKAIAKAGFGSAGWRVRIEPGGCILIEPGEPLAQHEVQGANEWDDLLGK